MNTKEYRLEIENNVLVFYNTKTNSEGGRFGTKFEAFSKIGEMLLDSHIDVEQAISLFEKILVLNFPLVQMGNLHPHLIIKKQILDAEMVGSMYESLHDILIMKQVQEPYLHVCEHCKDHGVIYTSKARSASIYTKPQGFACIEKMYQDGLLNLLEKEKLMKEMEESKIPMYSEDELSQQN